MMEVNNNAILPDVLIIEPRVFHDARGLFYESFQAERFLSLGIPAFVQDNCSRSARNVVRGLHYQLEHSQGKLVYVTHGAILDVAVDIRVGSKTFGKAITVELSDENHRQLYIPPGFAHGFWVLSERADVIYKCTDFYCPVAERGLIWNDPDIEIVWPSDLLPTVSDKDRAYPKLKDISLDQLPAFL